MQVSIIVPAFNEAGNLVFLHERLVEVVNKLSVTAEFVFVDDGSTDNSADILREMTKLDDRVKVVRLSRNFGSHNACLAGLRFSSGEHCTLLAADLQDPPEVLGSMLNEARKGHDVVWGFREDRHDPIVTRWLSYIYNRIMRSIALPNFPKQGADFVLMSRRFVRELIALQEVNTSLFGQVLWLGFSQSSVPYIRAKRRSGRSKWSLAKKLKLAVDSFVSFSFFPIRLISFVGFGSAAFGALYAMVIVLLRLTRGTPIEGWASLMVVVLVVGGIQMLMLGIVGEYLWRTLETARRRPPFVVADTLGFGERHGVK